MAYTTKSLPLRSAGGGQPSASAEVSTISEFSPPVLQHLKAIQKSLPQNGPFQDGVQTADELSFLTYMSSPSSSALSPPLSHDLSYPLSSYYISSSHNTYLSGHQLYGEATTESYTNVLRRGCRCLEIDVWDGEDTDTSDSDEEGNQTNILARPNSKLSRWNRMKAIANDRIRPPSGTSITSANDQLDGSCVSQSSGTNNLAPESAAAQPLKPEPRVLHGYTLIQSVTFRAVCNAIGDSAFAATDLPLIVSLEVHASLSQQETMVEIMKEAWGNHLVDITQSSEADIDALPSPDALRRKILIKVKWTPNSKTGESNNPLEHITSTSTEGNLEDGSAVNPTSKQKKASKVLTALSELGVYTRAYTFKQFSQPEASIPTHVFSLSEGKVHDMHVDPLHGPAMFNHNIKYLMRVYPKGTRISSSNVDPTFHWRQGAQMIALNWQKLDKGMMLNEGMFGGQEGWALKPEGYRAARDTKEQSGGKVTGSQPASIQRKHVLDLDIEFLAGQNLPLPLEKESSHLLKMKPYIKVQLHVDTHGPPGQGKVNAKSSRNESDAYGEDDKEDKKAEAQNQNCQIRLSRFQRRNVDMV